MGMRSQASPIFSTPFAFQLSASSSSTMIVLGIGLPSGNLAHPLAASFALSAPDRAVEVAIVIAKSTLIVRSVVEFKVELLRAIW